MSDTARDAIRELTEWAQAKGFNMAAPQDYSDPNALRIISNRDYLDFLMMARQAGKDDYQARVKKAVKKLKEEIA